MLSNLDTAWRYPLALLLGLLTGLYIGGMLATIYVITAFRESLDTLSPMGPWMSEPMRPAFPV
jgi:type IV secretion system protein VirD4